VASEAPVFEVGYFDDQPLNLQNGVRIFLNGVDVTDSCNVSHSMSQCSMPDLATGAHELVAKVVGQDGLFSYAKKGFLYLKPKTTITTTQAQWIVASGAPTASNGLDGDIYLDSETGSISQKIDGNWALKANITGPQGEKGAQGLQGLQGLQGETGAQGHRARPDPCAQPGAHRAGS
jgi:hypothetical protein